MTGLAERHVRLAARDLLDIVLDTGTFTSWDTTVVRPADLDPAYADELTRAAQRSGADESVITGFGTLDGRRVAVLVSEFQFLGGSIGLAAAERLVRAIRRATQEGLPLLATTASGGTRMQEGTAAFVQMVRVTEAITAHRRAGLPYLVYLRHPTTGGVFASWGSLGHITFAEPGALVGFLGPKVFQALHGEPFPEHVQVSENLARCGLIDGVLRPEAFRDTATRALKVIDAPWQGVPTQPVPVGESLDEVRAWTSITRTRRPDRPGVRELLRTATDVVLLHGSGVILALARFSGMPCVLIGQDRTTQPVGPEALVVARRGARLASELGLPLVSVIDTPGASLSPAAEEGGLAGEIAGCLAELVNLRTRVLSVLLGQGTGGLALAMLPADRVIAAGNGWLSPLPLEGASAIVYGDTAHAEHLAAEQQVSAADLLGLGVVDRIVPEYDDAADEPVAFVRRLCDVIAAEISLLGATDPADRVGRRSSRFAF